MKNIEWLKKEIPNLRGYAVLIDGEDGEWEPVTTVSVEDIYELINRLDELEVLSQEWIDEHRESTFDLDEDFETVFIKVEDLQNLLVPKQELPVIPKFVAEAIEEDKELGYDVYESIDLILGTNGGGLPSISDWVARNIDKYANAWLNGFTVEEEQKYIVKIPTNENNDIPYVIVADSGDIWIDALPSKYKLTEEEIRGLTKGDVLFEHFAVKVEELEE